MLTMDDPRAGQDAPGSSSNLAFQVTGSTVLLTWSAPAGGGAVASYILEAGTATGQSNIVSFDTGSAATTFTATSVPNGTYFVRVRARNADGASLPSNEVTIVVGGGGGPCLAPPTPTGFAASASGNTITLTWNTVAGALSFIIEAGSAPGAANIITFDTGNPATSFTGTAPNGTYYLRVRVRTACGMSPTSNEAVLTVGGGAPPPGPGLTGRWIGLVADGDGLTSTTFGLERWDWQLDLIQSGSAVTGTLTQTDVVPCRDAPNCRVQTALVTGTAGSGTFSFTITGSRNTFVGSATLTASRMTGTATSSPNGETGTFAVNRR
jgi:hypothetical protein